ncbi:hypothetical protein [Streptomyces sp. NPDC058741]|uniref:hypothetical protein n=1 Tax=unclassified Streptomyces TaxID=2593676 RepID=UPI003687D75F
MALAVAGDSAPERAHAASRAPLPDADATLAQVESLGGLGGALTPVADLLTVVLKADDGQLPPSQAAKLHAQVQDAVDQAAKTAPATVPATGTSVPNDPLPQAGTLPAPLEGQARQTEVSEGLTAEALAALEESAGDLFTAVTSGEAARVTPAVDAVMSGVVNTVAATLVGSKLPAPDLAGLSSLPKAP